MKPVNERIELVRNLCCLLKESEPDILYLAVTYTGDCEDGNGIWFYNLSEFMTAENFHELPQEDRKRLTDEITFSRFQRSLVLPDWCKNHSILAKAALEGWGNLSVVFEAVLEDFLPEDPFKDAGSEGTMLFNIEEQSMQHYHAKNVIKEEIQHISYEAATLRPVPSKTTKTITKPIRKVKS